MWEGHADKKGKKKVPQGDPTWLLSYDCYVQEAPSDMGVIARAINWIKDQKQPTISAQSGVITPTAIRRELRVGSERHGSGDGEGSEAQLKKSKRVYFAPNGPVLE